MIIIEIWLILVLLTLLGMVCWFGVDFYKESSEKDKQMFWRILSFWVIIFFLYYILK